MVLISLINSDPLIKLILKKNNNNKQFQPIKTTWAQLFKALTMLLSKVFVKCIKKYYSKYTIEPRQANLHLRAFRHDKF